MNKKVKSLLKAVLYCIIIVSMLVAIIGEESSTIIFATTYVFIMIMVMEVVLSISNKSSARNDCALTVFDMLSGSSEDDNSR